MRVLALVAEELLKSLPVEADHDFVADDEGGRATAVVGADQRKDSLLVAADVLVLIRDTFLRKVGLGRLARRSAGLREQEHSFRSGHAL